MGLENRFHAILFAVGLCTPVAAQAQPGLPSFEQTKTWSGLQRLDDFLGQLREQIMTLPDQPPTSCRQALDWLWPAAFKALTDKRPECRLLAVKVVGLRLYSEPAVLDSLLTALGDSSRSVRWQAVLELATPKALDAAGIERVRKALLKAATDNPADRELATAARSAAERLLEALKKKAAKVPAGPGGAALPPKYVPPRATGGKNLSNERSALVTLQLLLRAQATLKANGAIDVNGNGDGEYGYFKELAGAIEIRAAHGDLGKAKIRPPFLSDAFAKVRHGIVERGGYCFRIFLPDMSTKGVPEAKDGGGRDCPVDPRRAEALWCAYAWPKEYGAGRRVFFVNEAGDVLAANNAATRYEGRDRMPDFAAAVATTEAQAARMDEKIAIGAVGRDGNLWSVAR